MDTNLKLDRSSLFYLAFMASIFYVFYKAVDNIVIKHISVAPDAVTAASAYLVVGGWIGAISGFIFQMHFGKVIDPKFKGIVYTNKKLHKAAFYAGFISAFNVLVTLLATQEGDPSVLIAVGSSSLLFTTVFDIVKKNISFKFIILPAFSIIVGSLLAAYNPNWSVTVSLILLVFVISNLLGVVGSVFEQKGTREVNGVNMQIWRFLWLAFWGTVLSFCIAEYRGFTPMLIDTIQKVSLYWLLICIGMLFVFLRSICIFTAQKDHNISTVSMVTSPQIILAYVVTILADKIYPGIFGTISSDITVWLIRLIGASLLIFGVKYLSDRKDELKSASKVV